MTDMEVAIPVKGYNLAPPSEQDLFASLTRLVGPDEARRVWDHARQLAGMAPGAALSMDQFDSALQQLRAAKGIASVAGSSILVRLRSYRTLSALSAR
jgi:hypothetical protein